MKNKRAEPCFRCGEMVPAGEGDLSVIKAPGMLWEELKHTRNMWFVQHLACKIKYNETNRHYVYRPDE